MELKKLDKKVRALWLIESIMAVIIILAVCLTIILLSNEGEKLILLFTLGIPCGLLCIFLIVYPILRYAFYSYGYSDKKIVINKGVIFKSSIVIPVKQIQDLHVYEGPIMMILGLGGVFISTAGSSFNVACIDKKQAGLMVDELEEYLSTRLGEENDEEV